MDNIFSIRCYGKTQMNFITNPMEKEMATHSSILAWGIPQTEGPGGLQLMGSQRVGHDWVTHTHTPAQYVFALSCLSVSFRPAAVKQTPPPISSPTVSNLAIPKVLIMIVFDPHDAKSLVFIYYWPEPWWWGDMKNFLTVHHTQVETIWGILWHFWWSLPRFWDL